jgi:hypothetical protein
MAIRGENPIRPNIARLPQSACVKIRIFQWNGVLIPHPLAGDLAQNDIVPL